MGPDGIHQRCSQPSSGCGERGGGVGAPRAPRLKRPQRSDSAPQLPALSGRGRSQGGGGAWAWWEGRSEAGRGGAAWPRPPGSRDARGTARVTSARAADGGAMAAERDVRARLRRAGQEHLLRFCAELAPGPRAALLAELRALEPGALREHCRRAAAACARPPGPEPGLEARLRPLPPERVGSASRCDPETRRLWEQEGRRGGRPGRAGPGPKWGGGRGGTWRGSACSFLCGVSFHTAARDSGVGRPTLRRGQPPPGSFPSSAA